MMRTIHRAAIVGAALVIPHMPALAQGVPNATAVDLFAIAQPILAVAGTVIASLLTIYVPRGLALLQKRTNIQLTDQQRATMLGAVQTAAGVIETTLDQGVLRLAHINISNPTVRAEATAAINAVPVAAAALNMTVDGVARMIVGAIDTNAHGLATQAL